MKRVPATILFVLLIASPGLGQGLDRGIEQYKAFQFAEAEGTLREVTQAEPENSEAHRYLALTLLAAEKVDEAEGAANRARELAPDSDAVRVTQARVFIQKQRFDEAEGLLREAGEINGENPEVYLYRGALRLAQRNYQAAVDELNGAISRRTDNPYAHYYSGLAWNGLRKPDKMIESFQTFLRVAPNAPEAARVKSLLRSAP